MVERTARAKSQLALRVLPYRIGVADSIEARRAIDSLVKLRVDFVKVHELVGFRTALAGADRAFIERFEHALALHDQRDFPAAVLEFEACLADRPDDRTSRLYVERCRALVASPPGANWTPELEMHEK